MNFFNRRKVLKGVNYLELTPLHRYEHEISEQNKVSLRVPRFENKMFARMFSMNSKRPYVLFHLDTIGSEVYLSIDGENTVGSICEKVSNIHGPDFAETELRVTKFLTQLYLNKMITFKEIES